MGPLPQGKAPRWCSIVLLDGGHGARGWSQLRALEEDQVKWLGEEGSKLERDQRPDLGFTGKTNQ